MGLFFVYTPQGDSGIARLPSLRRGRPPDVPCSNTYRTGMLLANPDCDGCEFAQSVSMAKNGNARDVEGAVPSGRIGRRIVCPW